jgi:hypothetical protein
MTSRSSKPDEAPCIDCGIEALGVRHSGIRGASRDWVVDVYDPDWSDRSAVQHR